MAADPNLVRNPSFRLGRTAPRGWQWVAGSGSTRWQLETVGDGPPVMRLSGEDVEESGFWSRRLSIKAGRFHRVEACIECELRSASNMGGLVLTLQPDGGGHSAAGRVCLGPVLRSNGRLVLRGYYQAPAKATAVELAVGLHQAAGEAAIHRVAFIPIEEPEFASHLLAIPPPAHAVPAPRTVRSICVVTADDHRPIVAILRVALGDDAVSCIRPDRFRSGPGPADAMIFTDDALPAGVRSMSALLRLADKQLIVVSLGILGKLARGQVALRTVRQQADPILTTVHYANHLTRGFALADSFAFAAQEDDGATFVQRHVRRTVPAKSFCRRHGLLTILKSEADSDATSGHPVCLYRPTPGGGLLAVDMAPFESRPSTLNETESAVTFLLNAFGGSQAAFGQYAVPAVNGLEFRKSIDEFGVRFPAIRVKSPDGPIRAETPQWVTIGSPDAIAGLSIEQRPVILLRSGLTGHDLDGVYGSWLWWKQLVRPQPHTCGYALPLLRRYRLAWSPLNAAWAGGPGFRSTRGVVHAPDTGEWGTGPLAAILDVTSADRSICRVVLPSSGPTHDRLLHWLPNLAERLLDEGPPAFDVAEGDRPADRGRIGWRRWLRRPRIEHDDACFTDALHRAAAASGAARMRLELPAGSGDGADGSIRRTHLAATMIELLVGLQYGLIAVNRTSSPVSIAAFEVIDPGGLLCLSADDMPPLRQVRVV